MVSIYLAETSPPEGSLVLFGKVFLLEEEGPEVLSLGEDPLLGPTQARRILVGPLEELLGHPILQETARRLQREYLAARAQGKGAEEVRERARRVAPQGGQGGECVHPFTGMAGHRAGVLCHAWSWNGSRGTGTPWRKRRPGNSWRKPSSPEGGGEEGGPLPG